MFESPSRMSGNGRESLPDVREWSADPPGCPQVFRMPSRMLVVGMPSWMPRSGREALPNV